MKKHLLLSAGLLALSLGLATSANAAVSGTLGASYASDTNSGSGDLWNINGSLTGTMGANWGLEATGGYHNLSAGGGGGSADIWNIGGSVFWAGMQGRLAGTVNYYSFSVPGIGGGDIHQTSYGIGGEWYAGPNFTVAVKGGGNSLSASGGSGSASGGYAGGMLQWYVMPDLSLSGSVDYTGYTGSHITSETAKIEWLFSHHVPVSLYGGYEHADFGSGSSGGDLFFVGLKFYFNGPTGGALVDRQRNGSLGYIAENSVLGIGTF